jgi:hypothetical protein
MYWQWLECGHAGIRHPGLTGAVKAARPLTREALERTRAGFDGKARIG